MSCAYAVHRVEMLASRTADDDDDDKRLAPIGFGIALSSSSSASSASFDDSLAPALSRRLLPCARR